MRLRAVLRLITVFLAAGTLSFLNWAESSPVILIFTNVNVVDTRTGHLARNLTVVVKNGRIAGVAKVGLIEGSRRLQVINAGGKYLIPGLWDMHVHTAGGPAAAWDENIIYPLYIANGVTGVRDMGGDPTLLEQRRQRIEHGGVLGPHMVRAGPFLDAGKSDSQIIAVNTPAEGREAVRKLKKLGADFVKVLSGIPRDAYLAIAEESARLKMRFVGHVPEAVSVSEASAVGQRSIEHLSGILLACSSQEEQLRQRRLAAIANDDSAAFAELKRQTLATYNPDKARTLFAELTDNNTYQVPTLVWWRASANADTGGLADDSRLKYVPAWARAEWDQDTFEQQTMPGELADRKELANRYMELVRSMHRAGVPFLAGTDGPDAYVFPGFSLHDELELLVKSGFTNAEALAAATFYPALFMAKLDQFGVIESGRVADMVLLDANPLEDIRNTRKISAVVLGGKYYAPLQLDKILAQIEQVAKKPDAMARGQ
jgi:Amidohydrolase family